MRTLLIKNSEKIKSKFKEVVRNNKLEGIFLADMEGLPIVSFLDEEVNEEVISASSAAIVSAGMITANDAKKPDINQIIVDTEQGYMVFIPVKNEFILCIITQKDTKLGMLRLIADEVEEFLEKLE
ncbi:MAG: hypothetical protein DSY42_04330 [Aquifex sp.]|nr:MAG: hypothetical protein DSY42_04330 [Aquifex sp.]